MDTLPKTNEAPEIGGWKMHSFLRLSRRIFRSVFAYISQHFASNNSRNARSFNGGNRPRHVQLAPPFQIRPRSHTPEFPNPVVFGRFGGDVKCQIYPSYETVRSAKNLGLHPFRIMGDPPMDGGLNLYRFRGPDPEK